MSGEGNEDQGKIWDLGIIQKIILIAFILIALGLIAYALNSTLK